MKPRNRRKIELPTIIILCIEIFLCRIFDVALGTIRTILTVRGKRLFSAVIGFVEVFIWFLVVRSALDTETAGIWVALAYAGGFAAGTYIGGVLADVVLKGLLNVQIITSSRSDELINAIRDAGFAVSVLNVNSSEFGDEKYMLVIEIKSGNRRKLESIVYKHDPRAFIMIRETKFIQNGFLK